MGESGERDPRTHAVIGAAMAVHRELGYGFLEAVYGDALEAEMTERGIPFQREAALPIYYRGRLLTAKYKCDFLCFGSLVVEIKALQRLGGIEEAQLLHYLRASKQEIGLLLNFGAPSLGFKRMVFTQPPPSPEPAPQDGP